MTPAQRTAVQAAIANAATLEEVQRLEAALSSGQMPSSVKVGLEFDQSCLHDRGNAYMSFSDAAIVADSLLASVQVVPQENGNATPAPMDQS